MAIRVLALRTPGGITELSNSTETGDSELSGRSYDECSQGCIRLPEGVYEWFLEAWLARARLGGVEDAP